MINIILFILSALYLLFQLISWMAVGSLTQWQIYIKGMEKEERPKVYKTREYKRLARNAELRQSDWFLLINATIMVALAVYWSIVVWKALDLQALAAIVAMIGITMILAAPKRNSLFQWIGVAVFIIGAGFMLIFFTPEGRKLYRWFDNVSQHRVLDHGEQLDQ